MSETKRTLGFTRIQIYGFLFLIILLIYFSNKAYSPSSKKRVFLQNSRALNISLYKGDSSMSVLIKGPIEKGDLNSTRSLSVLLLNSKFSFELDTTIINPIDYLINLGNDTTALHKAITKKSIKKITILENVDTLTKYLIGIKENIKLDTNYPVNKIGDFLPISSNLSIQFLAFGKNPMLRMNFINTDILIVPNNFDSSFISDTSNISLLKSDIFIYGGNGNNLELIKLISPNEFLSFNEFDSKEFPAKESIYFCKLKRNKLTINLSDVSKSLVID